MGMKARSKVEWLKYCAYCGTKTDTPHTVDECLTALRRKTIPPPKLKPGMVPVKFSELDMTIPYSQAIEIWRRDRKKSE